MTNLINITETRTLQQREITAKKQEIDQRFTFMYYWCWGCVCLFTFAAFWK